MRKSLLVTVIFSLGLAIAAQGQDAPRPPCQSVAVAAWLNGLKELPKDFEAFAALPESHRKAVYGKLTETERVELWQRQWQEALLQRTWKPEQEEVLQEARRLFSADVFAVLRTPNDLHHATVVALVRDLKRRAVEVFGSRGWLELFAQLGPVVPRPPKGAAGFGPGQPPIGVNSPCNCLIGDLCAMGGTCEYAQCPDPAWCGFVWYERCNGQCPGF